MLTSKEPMYQYLTVITDKNFHRLDTYLDIKNEPPHKDCKTAHLSNGVIVHIDVTLNKGDYTFKCCVPFGTCMGLVLNYLTKHSKELV